MKIISPKKGIAMGIIFLFIGVSVVPNISSDNPIFGNTIYVDDDADPSWYNATHVKTIQEGIDNATAGDTVFVYNGTYVENVIVNKAVNLTGEDKNNTIIDGGNSGDVVVISTNEVNISRFTIKNGGDFPLPAGIYISSNFTTVSDNNIISNSDLGILLSNSNNNTITGNTISNNGDGIRLWYSTNSTISDNIITNNYYGIRSWYSTYNIILDNNISSSHNYGLILGSSSNNNIITDNKISQNQNDGIKFDTSNNNNITNNTIGFSNYNGLNLYSSSGNTITGNNIISNNNGGICLYESGYNLISRNTITNNSGIGIDIVLSLNLSIYHNNFINNLLNAWDDQPNLWDNGYPSGGNYWDDYTGVDNYHGINQDISGSDGIGDTPYEITGGGNNKDYYPLMVLYRAAPLISNVDAQPDLQVSGGFVNVTCDVTDDVAVDEVWVNITYPDVTSHNFSMSLLGSYYFNQTYDMIGEYSYFIWANDTSGNSDVSSVYTFNITSAPDIISPVISNVDAQPDPQITGGFVNITCDVTDDVGVNVVKVNITYPDMSYHNETMLEGSYYWNASYTLLGTYYFFIWANDTSDNSNMSSVSSFVIQDNTLPVISSVGAQPDPQVTGGFVNITCDVTDDVAVDEVWVNITYPDVTSHNFSMNLLDSYYFNQTYIMIGTYSYFIWANDTSGNSNVSSVYSFNITSVPDTIPPMINNVGAYPSTRETAGYVNISCEVTDDVNVHLVKVIVIYPDDSRINVTMEEGYYYNATYTQLGVYSYFIWASDTSGNINVSETYNFLIVRWTAVLNISESSGLNDTVIFGEAYDALDNIDIYDIPKPPTPSEPFVYTWFDANLSEPYDKLWADYRFYPNAHKVWHLYLLCGNLGPVLDSTNITISWDKSNLLKSEYTSIILNNTGSGETVNMLQQENYTFTSNNTSIPHVFQIICDVPEETYITNLSYKWNFISLPFNQTITKTDLIVHHNDSDYNWTEAIDPANGPLIDPYIFGWKRGSSEQTYQAVNALNPGYGYWMYAYSDCELWIKNISVIPDYYITDIGEKWNTIGIPFDQSTDKTNLTISYNGTDYNWTEAIDPANGPIVDPYIFGWNRGPSGQTYQAVDVLKPGYGYWMYAYYDCEI